MDEAKVCKLFSSEALIKDQINKKVDVGIENLARQSFGFTVIVAAAATLVPPHPTID